MRRLKKLPYQIHYEYPVICVLKDGKMSIDFFSDDAYRGEGLSSGLVRGLLVSYNGRNITREGMGICSIAIRKDGYTYFPGRVTTEIKNKGIIIKDFVLNKRQMWSLFGKVSVILTRIIDITSFLYKSFKTIQKFVMPPRLVSFIMKTIKLNAEFENTSPVAQAKIRYRIKKNKAIICGSVISSDNFLDKIYILNEIGADFLDKALSGTKTIKLPSGWVKIKNKEMPLGLYNSENKIVFYTHSFTSNPEIKITKYWGMEKSNNLCWSGFEYEAYLRPQKIAEFQFNYEIAFEERDLKNE